MLDFQDFLKSMDFDKLHASLAKDVQDNIGDQPLNPEKIGWLVTHVSEKTLLGVLGTYTRWLEENLHQ